MKRVDYDNKPAAIEAVGNGSYLYRWDVEEHTNDLGEECEPYISRRCYEVCIAGIPTVDSITEQAIEALWGGGVEQKLINDYQASQQGILDESYATPYVQFLAARKALKEQIAEDFELWRE